jgi:hypothetical protein
MSLGATTSAPGARLGHSHLAEQVHRAVIVHLAVPDDTAVPVVGVLAQADVAHDEQLGAHALHGADRLLHDPLLVVRLGAGGVLGGGQAEEDDAAEPESGRAFGVLHELIHGRLEHTGQRPDLAAHSGAVRDEQRPHEL